MENSLPLNRCHVHYPSIIINRSYTLLHSMAVAFFLYYRASFLFQLQQPKNIIPLILLFTSELLLSFIWLLGQAYNWNPVSRTAFPDSLPEDDKLPGIDVFICTADPEKEPTVEVMNTVISAMALDYPPEKLHIYLSDDAGSSITLHGMREAWRFARCWLPFCKRFGIETASPAAYFAGSDHEDSESKEFSREKEIIKEKYEMFKAGIIGARDQVKNTFNHGRNCRPSVIEVIQENSSDTDRYEEQVRMPLLVYVSREKHPSHSHHFKAGALNVLLRVSGVMSNSAYILVLDCDMYCNDPSSGRKAMCFHLDPNLSPSLAFVQFPQRFHNTTQNDIYDCHLRSVFLQLWYGMDGLNGPCISGTNFYIKRESLYHSSIQGTDLRNHKSWFGPSNELIKSISGDHPKHIKIIDSSTHELLQETKFLASCAYEQNSKWGSKVGFLYASVVEDYLTSIKLKCSGWRSVYLNPSKPQFLGSCPTNMNEVLTQGTRWSCGLIDVCLSRINPLIYGLPRMSLLPTMCYGYLALYPLLYCLPLCCLAILPQLYLLHAIPLYPPVLSSSFKLLSFIILSALSKHLHEVGGSIKIWRNEQRIWMIKSVTCHFYGSLDAIMKKFGLRQANFVLTNKMEDDEQVKLYQRGAFNFQASTMFVVPLAVIVLVNITAFVGGVIRVTMVGNWDTMLLQLLLSFYIISINYAVIEGMLFRKDKGRIPPWKSLLSAAIAFVLLFLGYVILLEI